MDLDLNSLKKRLEVEKAKLEEELSSVATKDSKNPSNWQATYDKSGGDDSVLENEADPNDVADNIEEFEGRYALVNDVLEVRLKNINEALGAMRGGTYGTCKLGGANHQIEQERLEANPSATTCVVHMNEK